MQKTLQPDLELKELPYYTGTQHYYNVFGIKATDGVKYCMDNGYSWFVTDAVAVIRCKPEIRKEPFLTVELRLSEEAENEADMVITDGNYNELYTQHYRFTDAKRDLKLYCCDGVMLVPSEY